MTTGAVLCAAGDQGHVHGACHSAPFKVALLGSYEHDDDAFAFASVYSSETGIWSGILPTQLPYRGIWFSFCSTLIGNSLHWLLEMNENILEFDLDTHTLAVIKSPPRFYHNSIQIMQRMAVSAWLLCRGPTSNPASKFGRGRSIAMVRPYGCCASPLDRRRYLGWGLRLTTDHV